ncbi:MAG: hypothetical protein ACYC7E_10585 [Armatimonadota bacterium]
MRALAISCLISLFVCSAVVQAAEKRFVLREHIKRQWTNELLTYPFTAAKGTCVEGSLALTGPRGPAPVQLSQVQYWPGTQYVKSARLSFIAGLAPLSTDTYTVRYDSGEKRGQAPISEKTPEIGASPRFSDLRITPGKGWVELRTSKFGIRLLHGAQQYTTTQPAAQVPGPVAAMCLEDGTQFGGSRLFGEKKITGYSAKLIDGGLVFARVDIRYTYEDGMIMDLSALLAAGDAEVEWSMNVTGDALEDGWQLVLSPGLPALAEIIGTKRGEFNKKPTISLDPAKQPPLAATDLSIWTKVKPVPGVITNLQAWPEWWYPYSQVAWTFKTAAGKEILKASSLDAGIWVDPATPNTLRSWDGHIRKWLPLVRENGDLSLRINAAAGRRKWLLGGAQPGVGRKLNTVKDYVLDWPDTRNHPRLFMTRKEVEQARAKGPADRPIHQTLTLAQWTKQYGAIWNGESPGEGDVYALGTYLVTGSPEVAKQARLADRLAGHLNLLGDFDTMRLLNLVAGMYDTLIDTDLIPAADRPVFRAKMAYLGYVLADPVTWSPERGYRSYNLNMSIAHVLNRGIAACVIPDHPMAKEWVKPALGMMDMLLDNLGPAGEFPESSGYNHGSADHLLAFAIAARNAGFRNYFADPRMQRLARYLIHTYTPRESRKMGYEGRVGLRGMSPLGRGGAGGIDGFAGAVARATATSDPELSKICQWSWKEMGAPWRVGDYRLGGFEYLYLDPTLPAGVPTWTAYHFPNTGVYMRQGIGTKDEYFIGLLSGDFPHMIYPSETGSISSIFAKGVPLGGSFYAYTDKDELITSRVCLARSDSSQDARRAKFGYRGTPYIEDRMVSGLWDVYPPAKFGEQAGAGTISAFSSLPRQDYAAADIAIRYPFAIGATYIADLPPYPKVPRQGEPPVDWRRQVLFLKDDDPAGASYLLLRDTVQGNQPTQWQMWTVTQQIVTPDEMQTVDRLLVDTPVDKITPTRELKGDRFTAIGQFGVDVEYFIAAPTDTPRNTLHWGMTYHGGHYHGMRDYQDLLHLQLPGDGAYFVAFFPRRRAEAAPQFQALGDGKIIKVTGTFGTDYGFLSALPASGESAEVSFKGTAASVQDRTSGLLLALGAAGDIRYKSFSLTADNAVSLRVQEQALLFQLPGAEEKLQDKDARPTTVTFIAPGDWRLEKGVRGVKLSRGGQRYTLTVPAGVTAVSLAGK